MLLEINKDKQKRVENILRGLIEPYLNAPLDDEVLFDYIVYWYRLSDEVRGLDGINDSSILYLQEDIVNKLKDEYKWLTGIGVIEGAEKMMKVSFENGNLDPEYKEKEYEVV